MIQLTNVSKIFPRSLAPVVDKVSFSIASQKITVILGGSGSGKTTTLRMINRLIEPSSGEILFDGLSHTSIDLFELRRSIGYVFQQVGLFPHLNVLDNVLCALKVRKKGGDAAWRVAEELLARVHLDPKIIASRYPSELSGGQQQRVGIARALAGEPRYLLMDEPFGSLDPITREALQDELLQIKTELQPTIVFVTHDILEAVKLADTIVIMNGGRVEQYGTPQEIIQSPATEFVHRLFRIPRTLMARFFSKNAL